jgi:hypothetical protein
METIVTLCDVARSHSEALKELNRSLSNAVP